MTSESSSWELPIAEANKACIRPHVGGLLGRLAVANVAFSSPEDFGKLPEFPASLIDRESPGLVLGGKPGDVVPTASGRERVFTLEAHSDPRLAGSMVLPGLRRFLVAQFCRGIGTVLEFCFPFGLDYNVGVDIHFAHSCN